MGAAFGNARGGTPAQCQGGFTIRISVLAPLSVVFLIAASTAMAKTQSPLHAVPHDALVAIYHGGPDRQTSTDAAPGTLATASVLAAIAQGAGVLTRMDPTVRLWIDALASLPLVLEHPHALVLLDIRAHSRDHGSHRLDTLKAAFVIHTRGRHGGIERRLQHLLDLHTNTEDSVLETVGEPGNQHFVLRDRRLADWATFSWGAIGDFYVIAFGEGAFERISSVAGGATPSLAADPWFARMFEALDGQSATMGWYVGFDRLRVTEDRVLGAKIASVEQSLGLTDTKRGLWTLAFRGRALQIDGVVRRGGQDIHSSVANRALLSQIDDTVIPPQATRYAVIDCRPRAMLDGIGAAYMAARSPEGRESTVQFWRDVQERAGISIEQDIFAHLGRFVIVHDYPQHALGLPLMWTFLMRVKDEPGQLRASMDRLFTFVQREWRPDGVIRLVREPDGVWHLDFGIQGPALLVTDRWLILSFSPQAVRKNAANLTRNDPEEPKSSASD